MNKYQDFSVELSPDLLLQIMNCYDLKADDVMGDYTFDLQPLNFEYVSEQHQQTADIQFSLLKNSIQTFSQWPKQLSWPQFNFYINRLLTSWLDDYKSPAIFDSVLMLARCFKICTPASRAQPDPSLHFRFQSLLIHLLARVTNQFDQYRFLYSQNIDLETDLPNQYLMLNMLKQRLDSNHENNKNFGLIILNLNINLQEQSQIDTAYTTHNLTAIETIKRHLSESTTLFQLSSAELAILVDNLKVHSQLNFIASQLMSAFEFPLPIEGSTIILKPYFGCASTFKTSKNAISLVHCARLALDQGMRKNHQIEVYDPRWSLSFHNTPRLEEAVIKALQNNELEVYLQPIVSLCDYPDVKERCNGAELLLRWNNKDWPTISPEQLIDIIYKKGFGKIFIRWLINSACQLNAKLKSRYQRDISLTINLCAADLLDTDLDELISQSILLWEVPAENFVVEITESDFLVDEEKASLIIEKIVVLGCKLALDDFGTGYSSMTRLRNMPIDLIKIDQSFVSNIVTSNQDREIVQSIIQLAHKLGKEIVAEGVDDIETLTTLKEMKCEKIQGYYYSKPLSFSEFCNWIKHG